ncbi:MAG: phosphoribosyltransferase [Aquificae bacterium]|nr:phosphoribosyltransferase [Aquificota bacterium]
MFENREEAGKLLGKYLKEKLDKFGIDKDNAILLAIPRGGIPIAYYVAKETGIPFSLVITKKIAMPSDPEAAIGAIATDGTYLLSTYAYYLPENQLKQAIEIALQEAIKKQEKYLEKEPDLEGKDVFIIDDGIATGYTAMVAGMYAKNKGAKRVFLAVPVCPADSIDRVKEIFDEVFCLEKVDTPFFAVGAFYRDFHQVTDEEVKMYEEKAKEEGLFL